MREKLADLLEKAIRYADENYVGKEQNGKYCGLMADFLISEGVVIPTRCGECKRWKADGGYGLDLDGTKRLYGMCAITSMAYKENHFCYFGSRREK